MVESGMSAIDPGTYGRDCPFFDLDEFDLRGHWGSTADLRSR